MIPILKLNSIGNYKSIKVIILVVGSILTARVFVHSGVGVDEQIRSTSRTLLSSYWLRLDILFLLVMTVVEHQVKTAMWPHWSLWLTFIG